jgi:hypothetical protein
MPADDIVVKKVPAMGVVVIAGKAPAFGPASIVPVVNHLVGEFERLDIGDRIKDSGRARCAGPANGAQGRTPADHRLAPRRRTPRRGAAH